MVSINTFTVTALNAGKKAYKYAAKKAYNITHFAQIDAQKPQVNLGWYHKVKCSEEERAATGQKYKLVEATMSQERYNNLGKTTRNMFYGYLLVCSGLVAKNNIDAWRYIEKLPKVVAANISKAQRAASEKDSIIFDSILPLPSKLAKATANTSTPAGRFYQSLRTNKENLMADLGIDDATFNTFATVALKIAKEESQFGQSKKYKAYEWIESSNTGRDLISKTREFVNGDGTLSLGMTRFKIDLASPEEKALFDKYGITYNSNGSNIREPEKSAIATVIHLSRLAKDYPVYLENVRKLHPDLSDPAVKQSIARAQRIIFEDSKRPVAAESLRNGWWGQEQEASVSILNPMNDIYNVNEKDIKDLMIYASSIELSPEAYLAARWNNQKVIPSGERMYIACKNLMNIAAQKGYIANIDKTSRIIY